jgi:hypothetical protein
VVEDVVDGHRAEQALLGVDDRHRDEVVGRECRVTSASGQSGAERVDVGVHHRADERDGGSRSIRWKCAVPR